MTILTAKRYSDKMGQHLVATQDIAAGTILVTEDPYAAVLAEEFKFSNCATCFNQSLVKKCSSCHGIAYWFRLLISSRKCQKLDWKVHQHECQAIKKSKFSLNMTVRFICRLLILIQGNPSLLQGIHDSPAEKSNLSGIGALVTHYEKFDEQKLQDYELLARGLHLVLDPKLLLPIPDIVALFCLSTCNSMTISDAEGAIAGGLYGYLSLLNHKCCANASVSFVGSKASLMATRNISKGEQVFISYVDDGIPKSERVQNLKSTYYFECKCEWCSSDYEPLHLQFCEYCHGSLSDITWSCSDCKKDCSPAERQKRTEFVERYLQRNNLSLAKDIDINYAFETFEKSHHIVPLVLSYWENVFLNSQNWQRCTELMISSCNSYQILYGNNNFRYAIKCHKVARYAQLIPNPAAVETAIKWNRKAIDILKEFGPSLIYSQVSNMH